MQWHLLPLQWWSKVSGWWYNPPEWVSQFPLMSGPVVNICDHSQLRPLSEAGEPRWPSTPFSTSVASKSALVPSRWAQPCLSETGLWSSQRCSPQEVQHLKLHPAQLGSYKQSHWNICEVFPLASLLQPAAPNVAVAELTHWQSCMSLPSLLFFFFALSLSFSLTLIFVLQQTYTHTLTSAVWGSAQARHIQQITLNESSHLTRTSCHTNTCTQTSHTLSKTIFFLISILLLLCLSPFFPNYSSAFKLEFCKLCLDLCGFCIKEL